MFIPAWVLVLLGILGFVFLTPYRRGLIDFFWAVWDILCGAFGRLWDFIRGVRPAPRAANAFGWIGMIFLFIILVAILFVGFLYFVIGASIMTVGIATGHWQVALLLLTILLIWGMLSAVPAVSIFRPLRWVSRWVVRPLAGLLAIFLLIVAGWQVFGGVSPKLQGSIGRSAGNRVEEFANRLDKGSLKSEPEMGIFAKVTEDSQLYNDNGLPVFSAPKGVTVKVTGLKGYKTDKDTEGMTKVMLSNRHGDFIDGNEGWIPTRKLDWNWQLQTPKPAQASAKAERKSYVGQVEGKNCWLVEYYPGQQPSWIGPSLPAGEYEVTVNGGPMEALFGGIKKKIESKERIILSSDSLLEFHSDRKGGEMIRITIWRIG